MLHCAVVVGFAMSLRRLLASVVMLSYNDHTEARCKSGCGYRQLSVSHGWYLWTRFLPCEIPNAHSRQDSMRKMTRCVMSALAVGLHATVAALVF